MDTTIWTYIVENILVKKIWYSYYYLCFYAYNLYYILIIVDHYKKLIKV